MLYVFFPTALYYDVYDPVTASAYFSCQVCFTFVHTYVLIVCYPICLLCCMLYSHFPRLSVDPVKYVSLLFTPSCQLHYMVALLYGWPSRFYSMSFLLIMPHFSFAPMFYLHFTLYVCSVVVLVYESPQLEMYAQLFMLGRGVFRFSERPFVLQCTIYI